MADVSVKMGVSGISQFKQGMADAQASVKTLDAALKANEKQFKATGDAENHLAAQTSLLTAKMQAQQNIAKNAEQALKQMEANGVKTTSKSYQDMQRKLIEAQSAMLDTEMQMDNLGTAAAEAGGKTDKLTQSLGGINKKMSLDQVIGAINSITTGLENAEKKAVDLGKELWNTIMDSARRADDTATMAQMYGIDLDTFQRMQKLVANGMDTSVEAILSAQDKLKKGIGADSSTVLGYLKDLHLAVELLPNKNRDGGLQLVTEDSVDLFWKAGQAIMAMGDAYDKEAAAQALFGKSWKELVPLFDTYSSLEEYNAALEEQTVNTEDTIRDLAALNDAVSALESSWTTLKDEVLGSLAPALTKGAEAISGLLDNLTKYLQTEDGQAMLERLGTAVEGMFSDLSEIDPQQVIEGLTGVFDKIIGGLEWLDENKGTVVTALESIVAGWGLLKLTGGALEIVKLIEGITGLGAASGAAEAGAATGSAWGGAFASAVLKAAPWLVGLYTLLNPAGTAGANIDQMYAEGMVTEAGWEHWRNNQDAWNARLAAVGNRFGDLGSLVNDAAAMNIIGDLTIDDEQVMQRLQEELGLVPIEGEMELPEDQAQQLAEEIGTVEVNGIVHLTGVDGENLGVTGNWWGGDGSAVYKDRRPHHANGLWSVPFDGYTAVLHKGERIVPAREVAASRNFSSNLYIENMNMNGGIGAEALAESIAAANRRTMRGYGS